MYALLVNGYVTVSCPFYNKKTNDISFLKYKIDEMKFLYNR